MIRISSGKMSLDIRSWGARKQVLQYFEGLEIPIVTVGDDTQGDEVISILVESARTLAPSISIVVSCRRDGILPTILTPKLVDVCIIGAESDVVFVGANSPTPLFALSLNFPFVSFVEAGDKIVIVNEGGALGVAYDGSVLWQHELDLVTNWAIEDGVITLSFMDSPDLKIDIATGSKV